MKEIQHVFDVFEQLRKMVDLPDQCREVTIRLSTERIMQAYITSTDGSMYVHELRGVVFVTWVAKQHKDKALQFPADKAADWAKLIADMTGIECVATSPRRPGQL